jgi:hypothetical protein
MSSIYSEFVGSAASVPFLHFNSGTSESGRAREPPDRYKYRIFLSVGLGIIVNVCEPLQVCTFLMSFGSLGFAMSKMRTPAMCSDAFLGPPSPQSLRLPAPSAVMMRRWP